MAPEGSRGCGVCHAAAGLRVLDSSPLQLHQDLQQQVEQLVHLVYQHQVVLQDQLVLMDQAD
jgi:hypothetical protein